MTKIINSLIVFVLSTCSANVYSKPITVDMSNAVTMIGTVDEAMEANIKVQLAIHKLKPNEDRVLIIKSPGGSVYAGYNIIKELEDEKRNGHKLVCIVDGFAHSMAFNIYSHCDHRIATKGSKMIAHMIAIGGSNERLTVKTMRRYADEMEKEDDKLNEYNAKAMHLPLAVYKRAADAEKVWNTTELQLIGYVNEVVDSL